MQPDRILIIVWFDSDEDLISCLCSEANGIHLLLIIASCFTTLILKMWWFGAPACLQMSLDFVASRRRSQGHFLLVIYSWVLKLRSWSALLLIMYSFGLTWETGLLGEQPAIARWASAAQSTTHFHLSISAIADCHARPFAHQRPGGVGLRSFSWTYMVFRTHHRSHVVLKGASCGYLSAICGTSGPYVCI